MIFKRYLLPKVGHFQVLIMSEGIHRNQVFLHQNVVQTLLYWNQLKSLAQNCAKNYYLHSPTGVLCSTLVIISILLWFDGKNCTFDRKKVIAFLTAFPHCVLVIPKVKTLLSRNFCQKSEIEFLVFPLCTIVQITEIYSSLM